MFERTESVSSVIALEEEHFMKWVEVQLKTLELGHNIAVSVPRSHVHYNPTEDEKELI
jgi:hypothetical protein